jgi:hypothetical protein
LEADLGEVKAECVTKKGINQIKKKNCQEYSWLKTAKEQNTIEHKSTGDHGDEM